LRRAKNRTPRRVYQSMTRNGNPGKGVLDPGRASPLGPGKQTLTSQLDAEIVQHPCRGVPGTREVPTGKR
jgi:hypothetical protein